VVEVAGEKNSTLVMPVPVELLRFFEKMAPATQDAAAVPPPPEDTGDAEVEAAEAAIEHASGAPAVESEKIPPVPEVGAAPVPEVPEVEAARVPEVDASSIPEAGAEGASGSDAGTADGAAAAADADPVARQAAPAPRGGRRPARPR
jgi:hypothetical protein